MCANCLGNVDMIGGTAVAAATALRSASIRLRFGAAAREARRVERDRRVVAFLADLDLDPVTVLGASTVAKVEQSTAAIAAGAADAAQAEAIEVPVALVMRSKAAPAIL